MNKGGYSSNCKIVPAEFLQLMPDIHYHLANLWNRTTTKIFDIFIIITVKQQKFSESDPVLICQFSEILQSDPVLIRQNWLQSWSVFIWQRWARIRTGSDWENFCCFNVIILKISKILVVIHFTGLLNGSLYFAIKCKNSAGTILLFEQYPPLFTYNVEFL